MPRRARTARARGSSAVARKSNRGEHRGEVNAAVRMPSLASSSWRALEGERRDEERDGSAHPGDRPAAGDGRPADRRLQPPSGQAASPAGAHRRSLLARRRHNRATIPSLIGDAKASARTPADRDPRVREGEERDDHESSSRGARGSCRRSLTEEADLSSSARNARQLCGRSLAKLRATAPSPARDSSAESRERIDEQTHRQADDDRLDPGLE